MTSRRRADLLLVERGLFDSRAKAQAAIAAGLVCVNGAVLKKASVEVPAEAEIAAEPAHPYVSRGGVKLAAALEHFGVDPHGLACLDVGASTGGFADALLRRGAASVVCVDTGSGQLHETIRREPRVEAHESTDIRAFAATTPARFDLAVIDVSFISLALVLAPVAGLLKPGGRLIALIKPQFEVGRGGLGKGGVVRDAAARLAAVERIRAGAATLGLDVSPAIESPLTGGDGNQEYLLVAGALS